jgi:cytochrome P450
MDIQTVALTQSFIHRMAVHPDVQARAQAEIDDIVGRARLPGYSDEAALPYVAAVIKEVWRFNASSPLGEYTWLSQALVYTEPHLY